MTFGAVLMWGFLALLFLLPVYVVWVAVDTTLRRRRGEQVARSSGGVMGFEAVFAPSAGDARAVRDAEQILPAPAPTPGDGPGVIEGNRIVIETGLRPRV